MSTSEAEELAIKSDNQNMKQWIIKCRCGCGKTRPLFDKYGNVRSYIRGHGIYKP